MYENILNIFLNNYDFLLYFLKSNCSIDIQQLVKVIGFLADVE